MSCRWIEVLQKAVIGEIEEDEEPSEPVEEGQGEDEEEEEGTADDSSPTHEPPPGPIDSFSDTPSDTQQSPTKESSQELGHKIADESSETVSS